MSCEPEMNIVSCKIRSETNLNHNNNKKKKEKEKKLPYPSKTPCDISTTTSFVVSTMGGTLFYTL